MLEIVGYKAGVALYRLETELLEAIPGCVASSQDRSVFILRARADAKCAGRLCRFPERDGMARDGSGLPYP